MRQRLSRTVIGTSDASCQIHGFLVAAPQRLGTKCASVHERDGAAGAQVMERPCGDDGKVFHNSETGICHIELKWRFKGDSDGHDRNAMWGKIESVAHVNEVAA